MIEVCAGYRWTCSWLFGCAITAGILEVLR